MPTVKIQPETAKHYLTLESAYVQLCLSIGIDPDSYMDIDPNKRYTYRCDLHDSWEAAVAKKPYKPRRQSGRSISRP